MPVRVLDTPSRRDLVAYLQKISQGAKHSGAEKVDAPSGEY
jgi:hypothetical protein